MTLKYMNGFEYLSPYLNVVLPQLSNILLNPCIITVYCEWTNMLNSF